MRMNESLVKQVIPHLRDALKRPFLQKQIAEMIRANAKNKPYVFTTGNAKADAKIQKKLDQVKHKQPFQSKQK